MPGRIHALVRPDNLIRVTMNVHAQEFYPKKLQLFVYKIKSKPVSGSERVKT